jgi:serine/threonine protein phosphatase PrpC
MLIKVEAFTQRGSQHDTNEDYILLNGQSVAEQNLHRETFSGSLIALIADGVGSSGNPSKASRLACEVVFDELRGKKRLSQASLAEAVNKAHMFLIDETRRSDGPACASTICGVIVQKTKILVFNVGDTRAYQKVGRKVAQLSIDDIVSPKRPNVLSQTLGIVRSGFPNTHVFEGLVEEKIKLLICSDGVYRFIRRSSDLFAQAEAVVAKAAKGGSRDDLSIISIQLLP